MNGWMGRDNGGIERRIRGWGFHLRSRRDKLEKKLFYFLYVKNYIFYLMNVEGYLNICSTKSCNFVHLFKIINDHDQIKL